MTKIYRLSAVILSLGMLGAAACSSCSPQPTETSTVDPNAGQQSYTCGPNTRRVGNQCVGTVATQSAQNRPQTLNASGNN